MVKRALTLVGLLIAIPFLVFLFSQMLRVSADARLRSDLRQLYRHDAQARARLDSLSADALCEEKAARVDVCRTKRRATLIGRAAIAVGATGLGLLLAIRLAARAARNDRSRLVALFQPGLYVTVVAVIGLIAVHAALVIATIANAAALSTTRRHPMILLAIIAVAAVTGSVAMARGAFSLVTTAEVHVVGRALARDEAPDLWTLVERAATRLDALLPDHVVVGLDPTFFVTEAHVYAQDRLLAGRTLYCSLPLCRMLSVDELTAVIGHELGHFQGQDTQFSTRFYPIYRGTAASLESLERAPRWRGAGTVVLMPAFAVLGYFLDCFSAAESRIGRERELAADQAAASVTSPSVIASALIKVHAFDGTGEQTRHPTDTHPPLSVRLDALGVDMAVVSAMARNVAPARPAIACLPNPDALDAALRDAYERLLARRQNPMPSRRRIE